MTVTVPLRFPQRKKWLENSYSWRRWRKQGIANAGVATKLVDQPLEHGYVLEDANEFLKRAGSSSETSALESVCRRFVRLCEEQFPSLTANEFQVYRLSGSFHTHVYPRWTNNFRFPGSTLLYNTSPILLWANNRNFSSDTKTTFPIGSTLTSDSTTTTASGALSQPSSSSSSSSDEEQKKRENSARALKFTLYAFGVLIVGAAVYVFFVWGAPLKDRRGRELKDEFSDLPFMEQYFKRALNEVTTTVTYLQDPSREKLLPDPMKLPYHQPPYTVLIELPGVLVHPDWTYKTGWRFKKRPGVDYFLNHVAGYSFEVVVYTNEVGFTAFPIIDALDSQNVVAYRLFRDSTKYQDGHHVKDLDRINRDLSKVIVIDCNEKSVGQHRNNAIILPKWDGSDDDRVLFDLVALLQTISSNEIGDVRLVLEHYSRFADPIAEFREKQKLLALQENEALSKDTKPNNLGVSPSWLLNIFRKA